MTYQNRYSQLPDEHALLPVLGERTGTYFRQAFELKISGDKLPEAATQKLLDELKRWFLDGAEELWPIALGSLSLRKSPCIRKQCSACASGHGASSAEQRFAIGPALARRRCRSRASLGGLANAGGAPSVRAWH